MVALEEGADLALGGEGLAADEGQVLLAGLAGRAVDLAEVEVIVLAVVEVVDDVARRRRLAALGRVEEPKLVGARATGQQVASRNSSGGYLIG